MSGTNLGKMPILIVSLVIGIVMATTAIVPLVSDYAEAKSFENEGYFHMDKYTSSDDSLTITWDHTTPRKITVGTETYDLNTPVNKWVDLIVGDSWYIRYAYGGSISFIGFDGENITSTQATNNNNTDMSIVLNAGTITVTVTGSGSDVVRTGSYTNYYCISGDTGEYVMKDGDVAVYMLDDSEIYAIGQTTDVFGGSVIYKLSGTMEGVTITPIKVAEGITASEATINSTEVSGYEELNQLTSIVFTVSDGTDSKTITYSYFIVPSEVSAEPDNPAAYKALVKVVPVMAFVALIAAAAFMIYSKRD